MNVLKSNEKKPELTSEKDAEFDTKFANLNFYINLYTEMLNMLIDQTKMNCVINSQEKLLGIFKQISAIVDTFLDKLIVTKNEILSKNMKILTDLPSSSKRGLTHQSSFVISSDESDEQTVADQMEISDNDKMDEECSDDKNGQEKNEAKNLENAEKAMKELNTRKKNVKCQKCNERAKILRMVKQIQKNNRERISIIMTNLKLSNEQNKVFTEPSIIGTTIYGEQKLNSN
ncbi:hypothetical protein niasHT_002244 [Heterodera trifolii]|uniref:Uncharacterized protein n=1 Tax=Heterodera trifolii TaxID=157864 RepID=A0ABD2MFH8_9BILA